MPRIRRPADETLLLHGLEQDHHRLRRDQTAARQRRRGDPLLLIQFDRRDVVSPTNFNAALLARIIACSARLTSIPRRGASLENFRSPDRRLDDLC